MPDGDSSPQIRCLLASERRERIIELLSTRRATRTRELALVLGVAAATIRRDLEFLEDVGRVERVHGGCRLLPLPLSAHAPMTSRRSRGADGEAFLVTNSVRLASELRAAGFTMVALAGARQTLLATRT